MPVLVTAPAPAQARALGGIGLLHRGLTLGSAPAMLSARGGTADLRCGRTVDAVPAHASAIGGTAWRLALMPDVVPEANIIIF
jgi:hypothetical protein